MPTHYRKPYLVALLPCISLVITQPLLAVSIDPVVSWGAGALPISSDSDVSTNGTLINAFNVGKSTVTSTTVNTVVFAPYAFPSDYSTNTVTNGNYVFSENPGSLVSYNNLGAISTPFTTLSSGYETLLSSAGGADFVNTLTLTINGLTSGQQYLIQIWMNDSSNSAAFSQTNITAGNVVTLDGNTTNASGGIGQYAIGTFTATASGKLPIRFDGTNVNRNNPYVNAFQLRAIPEPSACGLLGIGALVLLRRRSRI